MATTNITIRIDKDLKTQLQELMSNLGMDVTTFFIMAAKQAVREQAIPFRPSMDRYNLETWKERWEVEYMKSHPEVARETYVDVDEMFKKVLAEE